MLKALHKASLLAFLALHLPCQGQEAQPGQEPAPAVQAAPTEEPNYLVQRLIIYNKAGDVMLQRNVMGWSTPGAKFDKHVTLRQGLDGLAAKYGLQIKDIKLAGLFTYEYGYSTALSTRSHYSARVAGGTLKTPSDMQETGWFPVEKAIQLMASDSQKSPPSFLAMTTRMLKQPETIWGGAFHVWRENGDLRSRMLEPFYPLGKQ